MSPDKQPTPVHEPAEILLFLDGLVPAFTGKAVTVFDGLTLETVDSSIINRLAERGFENAREIIGECLIYVRYAGTTSTKDMLMAQSLAVAILLTSDIYIHPTASVTLASSGVSTVDREKKFINGWGHSDKALTEEHIRLAAPSVEPISELSIGGTFNRVANALMFYRNGYYADNPDLALISFATCLEGLFTTERQELAYLLSMRLSGFLSNKQIARRTYFDKCKEVYRTRSKIVHGDKLFKDNERSAIYLVEHMVPLAEKLARNSLRTIFDKGLLDIFTDKGATQKLFDELLFSNTLDEALGKAQLR